MTLLSEMECYIQEWESTDIKPCNETQFIKLFLQFLNEVDDCNALDFQGEGAYFGKQIIIHHDRMYQGYPPIEIAYSDDKISVYTGRHNGFWTPEFISMDRSHIRFYDVSVAIYTFIYENVMGEVK